MRRSKSARMASEDKLQVYGAAGGEVRILIDRFPRITLRRRVDCVRANSLLAEITNDMIFCAQRLTRKPTSCTRSLVRVKSVSRRTTHLYLATHPTCQVMLVYHQRRGDQEEGCVPSSMNRSIEAFVYWNREIVPCPALWRRS